MTAINLDHMASSPLLPEVKEAMIEAINMDYGNPSSLHKVGEKASEVVENARSSVANLINASLPKEVVFTASGTGSVNHAIKGVAYANSGKGRHIVTSNIEHSSVIRSIRRLKMMDYNVTSVPVDEHGRVNPDDVANAIKKDTILVSIMHSNNEIGTIQPIEEIAKITKEKEIIFHTDAVDSVGVVPFDVQKMGADLVSFASNPFYGPTGVGGLYIRRGTRIWPLLDGGMQEYGKRAGTENIIGITGMGKAAELAKRDMDSRLIHLKELRETLLSEFPNFIDEYYINNHPEFSLPNLVSVSVKYIEGESVLLMLDDEDISIATRSACATGSLRASHVLMSIGRSHADAQGTMIITYGVDNTRDDIMRFLEEISKTVKTLRDISPLYNKIKK
ncbi:MAG: cysteine desulfurase [Desulfobacterales bacterium]|nr:cysteine desulfurase [Desulfobacteraceae bacterium]MBT4364088.1 cysteine desulfurase [Desulfobacteraceae bacterium]MBT7085636.1 cysteine desulfurase [Desulfobacterales bacterium]MBT7696464.1 cysteine desulfurase [Desulfobacterales bacterium]